MKTLPPTTGEPPVNLTKQQKRLVKQIVDFDHATIGVMRYQHEAAEGLIALGLVEVAYLPHKLVNPSAGKTAGVVLPVWQFTEKGVRTFMAEQLQE